jgi:glycine/sarcosine N-methyltransferase
MTYDTFSGDYDRFVGWPGRLAIEMPFIEQQIHSVADSQGSIPWVLDAACGTGMHAIALAKLGWTAAGADLSAGMIARARDNAAHAGVKVRFEAVGFGELARTFITPDLARLTKAPAYDAVLCLGKSLPHVLTSRELAVTLDDFATCLRSGGLLLVQNRNFEAVFSHHERWMEPQAFQEGDKEWLFLRFYDFDPDGLLTFNILTLKRENRAAWTQQVTTTHLQPLRQVDLMGPLSEAGFIDVKWYGNMAGAVFDPESSSNLVFTGVKR